MNNLYDVLVIGGGMIGSAIARELSRYDLKIGVLEKNLDVCYETSGRNSAVVHGGFAYDTGTLKAKLCVEGNQIMGDLSKELDFPFLRCGKELADQSLFVTLDSPHDRLTVAGVQYMLRQLGKRAGVKNVHPHRVRRTIATDLLARGMKIEEVKEFLGHEKLDTTMIYCTIKEENVQTSHRKYA